MTRRQCKSCPWRVSNHHSSIPGYCPTKARALTSTIAAPGALPDFSKPLEVMACHYAKIGRERERVCVGWLVNQLNDGNNIPLRMAVRNGRIDHDVKTIGKQHASYAEVLAKNEKPG